MEVTAVTKWFSFTRLAVAEALHLLETFRGPDLTQTIYKIEKSLKGISNESYAAVLKSSGARAEVLGAAGLIKQLAGQINVVIHALGILLYLPHILEAGERIEYVSLGAGNTGRAFDLETNLRIADVQVHPLARWARVNPAKCPFQGFCRNGGI